MQEFSGSNEDFKLQKKPFCIMKSLFEVYAIAKNKPNLLN